MDILKQNFDNTVRQRFGQTIEALESAFKFFNLDYYLIGAFVREVWTDHITGLPVKRATRIVGAKILGKEIFQIIESSPSLKTFILEILTSQLQKFKPQIIDEMFEDDKNDIHIIKLKLIKELLEEFDPK